MKAYIKIKKKISRKKKENKKKVYILGQKENSEDMNENMKLVWKEVNNAKGVELQQNKGWKWEAGTGRG